MRKILLTFILIILVSTGLPAQERERRFTLQTSPLLFMIDAYVIGAGGDTSLFVMDMEGQYKINDIFNMSLTLSSFVYTYDLSGQSIDDERNLQFVLKPMFVYRPFGTGLKGFYVGLYSNIGWQFFDIWDEKESWADIGFGINSGYKWVFNNGFTLQLGAGIGRTWTLSNETDYIMLNSDGRLTLPRLDIMILDFKLGYSF